MDARSHDLAPGSIAIVGMAGRFPSATSPAELWRLLHEGREATQWLTDEELLAAGVPPAALRDPNYVRAGLLLPHMECFDAEFFGFSPREAAILDPQHRHFLECSWEALEDAGHMPETFSGAIGVFGGCGMQAYMAFNLLSNPDLVESVGMFLLRHTGNDKDFLTTRVSYALNLQGPSISVQTACSTSLVAVHMAAQSLLSGECDMALAGGVSIELPHGRGYHYADGEILSPDGHCRAFDDDASGTLFGSGAAVVVLRRLEDAIADRDNIYAVIRGSAINNDGSQKAGYLAPSVDGQGRAAVEALAIAGVDPASVAYVEAHGTGTPVGDPIEIAALSQAYGGTGRAQFCGIGSLKTNIGHLDTAAGAASLMKVALSLKHQQIPASLNYKRPNSRFDLAQSPFYVVDRPKPWPRGAMPRRAAVNSLGVGGTNAHVVVEEAPLLAAAAPAKRDWQVFALSAKSASSLQNLRDKWADFLVEPPEGFTLADAAFTTQVGRRAFPHRCAVVARDVDGLRLALESKHHPHVAAREASGDPEVVFMFPGGGAQYPGVGRELLEGVPAFRAAVDECFRAMPADAPKGLRALMFDHDAEDADAARELERPVNAIPALFVIEYALAKMWESWGVKPGAVIGHSAGEYAAACLAGVMDLSDALSIVVLRGQLMEASPKGAMLAADLSETDLVAAMGLDLDLAAVNSPDLCVASGSLDAIGSLEERLLKRGVDCRRLRIDVAAHSRMLDPALETFRERVRAIRLKPPQIPFISNLTGGWADPAALANPEYWVRHLRQPVRFADGLNVLLKDPNRILLEVGPGQSLSALARQNRADGAALAVLPSTRKAREPEPDLALALASAGHLWALGKSIDWAAIRGEGQPRRVSLPTYAFERKRHWIEPGSSRTPEAVAAAASISSAPEIQRLASVEDWFSAPEWTVTPLGRVRPDRKSRWLVFADDTPLSAAVLRKLAERGAQVTTVLAGAGYSALPDGWFIVDPKRVDDYGLLLEALGDTGRLPDRILHLWSAASPRPVAASRDTAQFLAFDSLFALCQSLQLADLDKDIRLTAATAGTQSVQGEAVPFPERATLLGPCRVVSREIANVTAQLIDLDPADLDKDECAQALLDECDAPARDELVALRNNERWTQRLGSVRVPDPAASPARLRQNGVYLITGGLGGIALTLAEYLVREVAARLVLVSRRDLPSRKLWQGIAQGDDQSEDARSIRRILEIEAGGAEILVVRADTTDLGQMAKVVSAAETRFGSLNGIFHAAGVLIDGPIATKTLDSTRQVLDPKVLGGLVLNELLPPGRVDFFAVFSSTSVFLAPPGQIDYVAANAFLDALAASRPDGISIHWGIWGDRGMAVRAYGSQPAPRASGTEGHPLLGPLKERTPTELTFETVYDPKSLWVLNEHVVAGRPVFPGTGYIELARAAMDAVRPGAPIEIRNLSISEAMVFAPGEARYVRVHLAAGESVYELSVRSSAFEAGPWVDHARAGLVFLGEAANDAERHPAFDSVGFDGASPEAPQVGVVSFGPRWRNIRSMSFGDKEGVAEIELAKGFAGDLAVFSAHPALTDMAATFGLHLLDHSGDDLLYVPLSVERIRLYAPLPRRFSSWVRLVSERPRSLATFDVALTGEDGSLLASLDGFSLRCLPAGSIRTEPHVTDAKPPSLTDAMLASGIRAADGPDLFRRVLDGGHPQIVVSSIALPELRQVMARNTAKPKVPSDREKPAQLSVLTNGIERRIAGFWSELLGVSNVRSEDDFFGLGGHSLAAVRLFAKIRKQYGVDLPLATLFQAPSLKDLAAVVSSRGGVEADEVPGGSGETSAPAAHSNVVELVMPAWSPLVPICAGRPDRLPLFCVHGGGGNVLNLKAISDYLGKDQPFYGLQAQGVDGRLPPLDRIEAMASKYLDGVRSVAPRGPYCLAGYSGGGVIAFEMARQLRAAGYEVPLLVLLDTLSPIAARQPIPFIEKVWNARHWSMRFAMGWPERKRNRRLNEARLEEARSYVRRNELVPHDLLDVHIMDAYLTAQQHYEPSVYDGSAVLVKAREAAIDYVRAGPSLGWEGLILGGIEVHNVSGSHFTMMSEPAITQVAAAIRPKLDALHDRTTSNIA